MNNLCVHLLRFIFFCTNIGQRFVSSDNRLIWNVFLSCFFCKLAAISTTSTIKNRCHVLFCFNQHYYFKNARFSIFFGVPHLATCIFLFFFNEPELDVGIDPGMALTPLPSSIGRGSNSRPSDRKPSALLLDHSFCYSKMQDSGVNECIN